MIRFNWVPWSRNNSYKKFLFKVGSWSVTMDLGMSCSLKLLSTKTYAIMEALNGCYKAHKWAYLERWLTMTIMTDLLPNFGNPTMKSIEMSTHMVEGMDKWFNGARGFTNSHMCHWKVSYSSTKMWMLIFMPSQMNECLIMSYVF